MDFHFGDTTDTKIIFRKVFGAASVGPGNFDRPHDDFELDMIRISENWWWSSAAIYWSAEAAEPPWLEILLVRQIFGPLSRQRKMVILGNELILSFLPKIGESMNTPFLFFIRVVYAFKNSAQCSFWFIIILLA